jgi:hypothetical protein
MTRYRVIADEFPNSLERQLNEAAHDGFRAGLMVIESGTITVLMERDEAVRDDHAQGARHKDNGDTADPLPGESAC